MPLFLLLLLFNSTVHAEKLDRRRVLVLHSYNQGYLWTDEIQEGISGAFAGRSDIELVVDYMDANTYQGEEYARLLVEIYKHKYLRTSRPVDLLIACDDHALDFLLAHRASLFPGAPLVFCGINDFKPERLAGQKGITGVNEAQSMKETLELGLSLAPRTRRIAVVAGERISERINSESFKAVARDYTERYEISYLEGMSAEQVRETLLSFDADTLVVYLSYMLDAEGRILDWKDGVALAASNPELPVLVMSDFQVREGALGGKVVSGIAQGESAARLGLRILSGEDPDRIPVVMESPTLYLFDDRRLERLGIDYSALPPAYELTNLRTGEFIRDWHEHGTRGFFAYELFEFHGTNMLLIDPSNGIIVDANQAARRFYGYPRLVGMNISDINDLSPEEVRIEMAKAREQKTNLFNFRHRLADGSVRDIANYSWPVRVLNTDLLFSIIFDTTAQKQAEALAKRRDGQLRMILAGALLASLVVLGYLSRLLLTRRKAQTQLRQALLFKSALLDAIPNPVFYKDVEGRCREWNKAFELFTGKQGEALGAARFQEAEDRELYADPSRIQVYEKSYPAQGSAPKDMLVHKAAVIGKGGKPVGLVGVYTDLGELKRREEELRSSLAANRTLIKELHHRTKNNMQVIDSILTLKMSDQNDPALKELLKDIAQRIRTMALVHRQLYDSGDLSRIDFREYLSRLMDSTLEGYAQGRERISYALDCPELPLLIDYALPCAMAVNELLTNSCKHAFPDRSPGSVSLAVRREVAEELIIEYHDDGIGLDLEAARYGAGNPLGLTMLRMLVEHQLNGTLTFGRGPGMSCAIRFRDNTYTERVSHDDNAGRR